MKSYSLFALVLLGALVSCGKNNQTGPAVDRERAPVRRDDHEHDAARVYRVADLHAATAAAVERTRAEAGAGKDVVIHTAKAESNIDVQVQWQATAADAPGGYRAVSKRFSCHYHGTRMSCHAHAE